MIKPNKADEPQHVKEVAETLVGVIQPWYESKRKQSGAVDSNVMCAGLYITEFLAETFPLMRGDYATDSQVKGAGGDKAKAILSDHEETRRFTSEGGRTSRRTIVHAEELVDLLNTAGAQAGMFHFNPAERQGVAWLLQQWFVHRVRDDYFGRRKISAVVDPSWSVRAIVAGLIEAGRARGGNAAGAIVQHLVGAKLQIRFPNENINIESYTTADLQTGRAGDYQIGDTAIHVTMSPGAKVFDERCQENLRHGYRPRVLVPEAKLDHANVHAEEAGIKNQVAIQSIEDFVGTNIEEVAGFRQDDVRAEVRRLLELYNARIEKAESDYSLKIEIPDNL